ncbi:MAG: DNA-binding protein [Euryarchaeota archaeon]|nr:DNA-binding protein [Euryarchaeota archaeon]
MEDDAEIQELRRRKLSELQRRQQEAAAQEQQRVAADAQTQSVLRQILTPEARERMARVKIAHPEEGSAVEQQLVMLAQSGRLSNMIDDKTLQQILAKLLPDKREIRIRRM